MKTIVLTQLVKKCLFTLLILFLFVSGSFAKNSPKEKEAFPIYGNWQTFTTKNGLPDDKIYCVRADGDRLWVGTKHGLALYENGEWKTFTTDDGLAHPGVLAIDVSEATGDVWIGTMGGLNRYSAGKFETFNQFNSGLANDIIYSVVCDGKDVWTATGGGASHYDTYSEQWEIYTENNAPMHEPWTYGICAGGEKIFIAAWGGGVIEYTPKTKTFRDYVDPDGEMEIDLFPDDGLVHDITTGVSYANDILWVATYFGLNRYDGTHWKGYFDHDSGLASNFINFVRAKGDVVYLCTDSGLSSFDGKQWVSYVRNESDKAGKLLLQQDGKSSEKTVQSSISHNFVMGVDFQKEYIWVATSKGLSRGILQK
jgi:ligand-binding sensor domain-containing protein